MSPRPGPQPDHRLQLARLRLCRTNDPRPLELYSLKTEDEQDMRVDAADSASMARLWLGSDLVASDRDSRQLDA